MRELLLGHEGYISAALEKPDGLEFVDGFLAKGESPNVLLDTIAHLLHKYS